MSRTITMILTIMGFLMTQPSCSSGSKILVMPSDGSHWINMKVILKELHSRGHKLTILSPDKSWFIRNDSIYTLIEVPVQVEERNKKVVANFVQDSLECHRYSAFLRTFCQQRLMTSLFERGNKKLAKVAATMLENIELMRKLQDSEFDLMLTDPSLSVGAFLGSYLKLPMVFNVRWLNAGDGHSVIAPCPISYVPVSGSELNDQMTFLERTKNMLHYLYRVYGQHFIINPAYSDVLQRHFPPGTDLLSLELSADIWLFRTDFVFEFPRPTMPNMVYIGGFQCIEAKPLPAEFEAFMQSSGNHGVIIMSLGTLVTTLSPEVTESIAAAFAQLPQKVIWMFNGAKPSSLGNNTLLVNWMPQNDLLGHPKTRVFVAHGGTNGLYEAIYHGVPVLGMPLLFDQFDNILRLKVRGAAQMMEVNSLTTENFLEALKDILENPSYLKNIQHLSQLHRDQPVSPLDTAIFWIEYVIRNKGAAHLKSAGFSLPWYTYFCLDVAALFMVLTGTLIWGSVLVCRCLCCRSFKKKMKAE